MSQKTFTKLAGVLFGLKAIFGLIYIFSGWQTSIAGWTMPTWLIIVAIITDSFLAYIAAKLTKVI